MSKFAEILSKANRAETEAQKRGAGQWSPVACRAYNEALERDRETARLLEAAIAHEMITGRSVTPADEPAVRERLARMEAATAAVRAKDEQKG